MPSSPKRRAGMLSTLDDLLAGPLPARQAPERPAERHPARPARRKPRTVNRRRGLFNALDLLPGPAPEPAPAARPAPPRPRRELARNVLDELLPGPDARVRVSLELPPGLLEEAEDAAAYLAGGPAPVTLGQLAERGLRSEVDRLAAAYHGGRPFPRRRQA